MREAVIVSYALPGWQIRARRIQHHPPMSIAPTPSSTPWSGRVDKEYVEDCYLGNCAHGAPNIGRQAALLAGMPSRRPACR